MVKSRIVCKSGHGLTRLWFWSLDAYFCSSCPGGAARGPACSCSLNLAPARALAPIVSRSRVQHRRAACERLVDYSSEIQSAPKWATELLLNLALRRWEHMGATEAHPRITPPLPEKPTRSTAGDTIATPRVRPLKQRPRVAL